MKRYDINQMVNLQYIYSAMEILASAFDFSVNILNIDKNKYLDMFFITNTDKYYELRSPRFMVGISGRELAFSIFDKIGLNVDTNYDNEFISFFKSKEYWAMYMIAYYKYIKNISFREIFAILNINEIIKMYNTLHEASFDKFVDNIDEIINKRKSSSMRQILIDARNRKKLSQRELSEMSGINLRTLQKYESGEKDINKAEYSSVRKLQKILLI